MNGEGGHLRGYGEGVGKKKARTWGRAFLMG